MKWIGQHIWSFISRFRNDVYLEDVESGTIASGGNLGLDSDNKIVKATSTSHDEVTLAGTPDYITISGQEITRNQIDLANDVTGVLPSANLDADTAHLSGVQTFTGRKTFSGTLKLDGDITHASIGDGAALHIDASDMTDNATSSSGTAAKSTHVKIEAPRLLATNASVTTSDAATLYIDGAPAAGTNQTITRAWSMWIDGGNARFDGSIYSGTTEAINSSGVVQVAAQTVIDHDQLANYAANEHFTQANITTVGTISSGTWQGTALATAYIADDAVTFAKAQGVTPNIFDNKIKLIPSDFMANDDGGNTKFGVGYVESADTLYGMRPANNAVELFAFVSIPQGMTATHVDIFDKNDVGVVVYEASIEEQAMTSKGTGNCNTTIDITDVASTATNFLAIQVTTTSVNDKVYGGTVTIA